MGFFLKLYLAFPLLSALILLVMPSQVFLIAEGLAQIFYRIKNKFSNNNKILKDNLENNSIITKRHFAL